MLLEIYLLDERAMGTVACRQELEMDTIREAAVGVPSFYWCCTGWKTSQEVNIVLRAAIKAKLMYEYKSLQQWADRPRRRVPTPRG